MANFKTKIEHYAPFSFPHWKFDNEKGKDGTYTHLSGPHIYYAYS